VKSNDPEKSRIRSISELTYKPQVGAAPAAQTMIVDTTLYPWRVNAALKITVPGTADIFLGTGWFIGPYAVITAAHAVYPQNPGGYSGWAAQIEVTPGLNGGASPYGSLVSSLFYCPAGWQSDGDVRLDYGVILLNKGMGSEVGTFGYATYSDSDISAAMANLAGYPLNPPDGSGQGTQWYGAGGVANLDDSFIYYDLDSLAGESGSCVYRNIGDQSYAMAIHTSASGGADRGLRIIEPVYQNLQQWASMQG
jgi:glutamyl endopeptidase